MNSKYKNSDIAIVGMACRLPEARDYNEFWGNLINGKNSVKEIEVHTEKETKLGENVSTMKVAKKYCATLDDIDRFDNGFFNLSPREVVNMDPQQRILLEESWHCIEDSGISIKSLQSSPTSVFVGATGNDYELLTLTKGEAIDSYASLGSFQCMMSNRISHVFGLSGESITIDTACSSSLVAIHKAKQSLIMNESKYAIAAGVCLAFHPWRYITFSKSNMMSIDGQCKAFDSQANGFVQGEGVGVLLLMKLEEAQKEGRYIYGIVKGSAVNHCGKSKTIAAPSVVSQEKVINQALQDADVSVKTINYIEAHGTGTALGDPIEVEALSRVFKKSTSKKQYCTLGSVKTNIGHLASASGSAGIIRVLMMMKHKKIIKTLNILSLNPLLDWKNSTFKVALENCEWKSVDENTPLRAGVSGFGFGGVNAHVILEAYDNNTRKYGELNNQNFFGLSAHSKDSLIRSIEDWKAILEKDEITDINLSDVTKTLLVSRRDCEEYRIGAIVESKESLKKFLNELNRNQINRVKQIDEIEMKVGNINFNGFIEIDELHYRKIFETILNDVIIEIGNTKIDGNIKAENWLGNQRAFSFLMNYSVLKLLIRLGVEPNKISVSKKGLWVGLAISGMCSINEIYNFLSDKISIDEMKVSSPIIPFVNPIDGCIIKKYDISDEYVCENIMNIKFEDSDLEVLKYYVDKARVLRKTQFTYAKYLEEWQSALKDVGLDLETLLNYESLISFNKEEDKNIKLILLLITYGSLIRLNRKWDLSESLKISDERFEEVVNLTIENIISKENIIGLYLGSESKITECALEINKLQGEIYDYSIYKCMNKAVNNTYSNKWLAQLNDTEMSLSDSMVSFDINGFLVAGISDISKIGFGMETLLSKLWIQGIDIDWNLLFSNETYRSYPLPGYNYNRNSFWIEKIKSREVNQKHPMVDSMKSIDGKEVFVKKLSMTDFYVRDHVVNGEVILPGVAYLEMVREVAQIVSQEEIKCIKDVHWLRKMKIEDSKEAYISMENKDTTMQFEVYTIENELKIVHSNGKIVKVAINSNEQCRFDIEKIKSRCTDILTKEQCYSDVFSDYIGFDYGPGFQVTTKAFCGQTESLELLDLPTELEKDFEKYILHPSIIDAGLRAITWIGGVNAYKKLRLHIPFALGEIKIFQKLTTRCYSYAEIVPETVGKLSGAKRFNIYILDEEGNVLISIKDFTIREITKEKKESNIEIFTEIWEEFATTNTEVKQIRNILHFGDHSSDLIDGIRKKHVEIDNIINVRGGKSYQKTENQDYIIDIMKDSDYEKVITDLIKRGIIIDFVVHEWITTRAIRTEVISDVSIEKGYFSCLKIVKALLTVLGREKVDILIAAPKGLGTILPEASMINGLAKAILPIDGNIRQTIIHYDSKDEVIEGIFNRNELNANKIANEIMYSNGNKYIKKISPVMALVRDENSTSKIKGGATYLITGGLGKLGLSITRHLLETYGANVILIGRSELDYSRKKKLYELEKYKGDAVYYRCDVSNYKDLEQVISAAKTRFGKINGIFHCAGVLVEKTFMISSDDEQKEVIDPKVKGIINTDIITQNDELDFIVLFSSVSAIIGDFDKGVYAASNSFLDGFAMSREAMRAQGLRKGRCISINWPLWKDGGMHLLDKEKKLYFNLGGMNYLEMNKGLWILEDILNSSLNRVIVVPGEKEKISRMLGIKQERESDSLINRGEETVVSDQTSNKLVEVIEKYLKEVLSKATGLKISGIDVKTDFSRYGIDSIMIMDLNSILENDFEGLPKTLFFEYKNIEEISEFLKENYAKEVTKVFLIKEGAIDKKEIIIKNDIKVKRKEPLKDTSVDFVASNKRCDIAIVGLDGKYPKADTLDSFWNILKIGQDCVTEIPEERWDYKKNFDSDKNKRNKLYCKWGAFINGVDLFDAKFFNISPREAALIDPQERLVLESTYKAIENAGYDRNVFKGETIGVYVGVMNSQYQLYGAEEYLAGNMVDVRSSFASIANRVSYYFDLHGPSIAIDTMCSSALTAIHLACESIKRGESKMAIASSVNVLVHPAKYVFLSEQRFGSTEGKCRAFGKGGNGYVPGEGVGTIILKSLNDAIKDGDNIHGIIKGTAMNHGGKVSSFTVPNPNAQRDLILESIKNSGVNPRYINYIEAHGTGTELGDPIEIAGLSKAFKNYTNDLQFCPIGSVKSNIGHLESAAGMASLTKVLLQMKYKKLVPSIHCDELNDNIAFEKSPFYVQKIYEDWKPVIENTDEGAIVHPRCAGISSFGAGGTNVHIIVEEFDNSHTVIDDAEEHLIVLSAKNKRILKLKAKELAIYIKENSIDVLDSTLSDNTKTNVINKLMDTISKRISIPKALIDLEEIFIDVGIDSIRKIQIISDMKDVFDENILEVLFTKSNCIQKLIDNMLMEVASKNCKNKQKSFLSLRDMSYTLQVGREDFSERLAIISNDILEVGDILTSYSCGEYENPKLLLGDKENSLRIDALFSKVSGKQFVEKALEIRDEHTVANLWLLKVKIDWIKYNKSREHRRIELPCNIFEQQVYWVGNNQYEKPDSKVEEISITSEKNNGGSVDQVLMRVVSEATYTKIDELELESGFSDIGINSVLAIEVVNLLNEELGIHLSAVDLFNYSTIKSLTEFIINQDEFEIEQLENGQLKGDEEIYEVFNKLGEGEITLREAKALFGGKVDGYIG